MIDFTDEIKEVPSTTPDFQTELAKKLQQLVPEAVADGKIDIRKLKELLDSDTADDSERFGLFWPGKKRAMRSSQEPTTATLKPAKDESKDWDSTKNIFIEGDNLEALKILQKYYHNKIKMIYIDPPYNTGKDFVYPDNYKEGLASYLEFTKQVDQDGRKLSTNSDTDGRYHTNWLNMMYPRLKLARNLMTDDGVIFISIGDHEQDNLKKLCNEIFGESQFMGTITWKARVKPVNIGEAKYRPQREVEYVLAYERLKGRSLFSPLTSGSVRTYPYEINSRRYRLTTILKSNRGVNSRPTMVFDLNGYTPPEGQRWQAAKDEITRLFADGYIEFRDGTPMRRYFEDEEGAEHDPFYCFMDVEWSSTSEQGKRELNELLGNEHGFDTVKPVRLLKTLLQATTGDGDTALDFFSGSGTTAHAIMQLNAEDGGNRKHIQVQLPEPTEKKSEVYKAGYRTIADISRERIRRAGEKIKVDYADKLTERESPLDVGFKVFKLADSNFTKWRSASETTKDSLQQHLLDIRESSNDAATEEELLTEVLLKQGISLTTQLRHDDIFGLSVWNVGDTTVLAYLNERIKPSLDQLRAIAAAEPAKIIILEDAFKGDDELKTNLAQICKTNKIELWSV